jgi:phosphorylcholine metabolism protein LicD
MNKVLARKLSEVSEEEWYKVRFKQGFITKKPPFNLKGRTRNLLDVKEVLDDTGLKFWLTNGTSLAAYRERDWIPWDDDVDLDVMMEDYMEVRAELKERFINEGFIVRDRHIKSHTLAKMALFRDGEKTALRPLYLDPDHKYGDTYRFRRDYKYPRKFYETAGTIEFMGETFNIPSPVEEWLTYVYRDWKTPVDEENESVYSTRDIRR